MPDADVSAASTRWTSASHSSASIPITEEQLARKWEIEQHAYHVFEAFYSPKDLSRLGRTRNADLYDDVAFALVQSEINISLLDTIPEENPRVFGRAGHTLQDLAISRFDVLGFKPRVQVEGAETVYLTKPLQTALRRFLSGSKEPVRMNREQAREATRKIEFLQPYVKVLWKHWGGGWHLETHPVVLSITFDRAMVNAVVNFRIKHRGGRARFQRKGEVWRMTSSVQTWME